MIPMQPETILGESRSVSLTFLSCTSVHFLDGKINSCLTQPVIGARLIIFPHDCAVMVGFANTFENFTSTDWDETRSPKSEISRQSIANFPQIPTKKSRIINGFSREERAESG